MGLSSISCIVVNWVVQIIPLVVTICTLWVLTTGASPGVLVGGTSSSAEVLDVCTRDARLFLRGLGLRRQGVWNIALLLLGSFAGNKLEMSAGE
jgi:hypothetical protein